MTADHPIRDYPIEPTLSLSCWYAEIHPQLHKDCLIDTYDALNDREFKCVCECHKESDAANSTLDS